MIYNHSLVIRLSTILALKDTHQNCKATGDNGLPLMLSNPNRVRLGKSRLNPKFLITRARTHTHTHTE